MIFCLILIGIAGLNRGNLFGQRIKRFYVKRDLKIVELIICYL